MGKLKALFKFIPIVFATAIGIYLPIVALGYGLLTLLFEQPQTIFNLLLIYAGFFAVLACIAALAQHPKTKAVTQSILWFLVITFFVHSCNINTHPVGGCVPTRYIDCD